MGVYFLYFIKFYPSRCTLWNTYVYSIRTISSLVPGTTLCKELFLNNLMILACPWQLSKRKK